MVTLLPSRVWELTGRTAGQPPHTSQPVPAALENQGFFRFVFFFFINPFLQNEWSCMHSCFDCACPTSPSHHMRMTQRNDSHADCVVRQPWANRVKLAIEPAPKLNPEWARRCPFLSYILIYFLCQIDRGRRGCRRRCQTFVPNIDVRHAWRN